jgi:hypothetical protein
MAAVSRLAYFQISRLMFKQSQFGNQIALYMSLGLSKVSTILLIQRLFTRDMGRPRMICNMVTAAVLLWTFITAVLVSVGCSAESTAPISPSGTCPSIIARYKLVVATDAITDVILVSIPGYLVWQLQMSIKLKLQVLIVFAFRLPLIALACIFLKAWIRSLSADNPGVTRTPAIIYQQVELCVSLMAATIPCLKSFIRSFDTGSGVKATIGSSNEYGSSGRHGSNARNEGESYRMSPVKESKTCEASQMRSKEHGGIMKGSPRPTTSNWSPARLTRNASLKDVLGAQHTLEADRQSQTSMKELLIRREMHWEVTSEEAQRGRKANRSGALR